MEYLIIYIHMWIVSTIALKMSGDKDYKLWQHILAGALWPIMLPVLIIAKIIDY